MSVCTTMMLTAVTSPRSSFCPFYEETNWQRNTLKPSPQPAYTCSLLQKRIGAHVRHHVTMLGKHCAESVVTRLGGSMGMCSWGIVLMIVVITLDVLLPNSGIWFIKVFIYLSVNCWNNKRTDRLCCIERTGGCRKPEVWDWDRWEDVWSRAMERCNQSSVENDCKYSLKLIICFIGMIASFDLWSLKAQSKEDTY